MRAALIGFLAGVMLAVLVAAFGLDGYADCYAELDRADAGTVLIRADAVDAVLGAGEIALDDGGGTLHNVHTQVVVGALRINVSGDAQQVRERLRAGC